ncbi:MAG: UDP-N-acetylglucosamine 1-carboxyvinyltransferase [Bdellovibrionales bacterium]|nr:UDP-N-acetylglucosamine 1-carboxyvinyltransferase [Bdellovibrionales bacterium]
MDKISIIGGRTLKGTVQVSGSKNAILPLLFSSLLADGEHVFHNVPDLKDVETSCLLLKHLGCELQRSGNTLKVKTNKLKSLKAPYQLVRQMRAGILVLGPLLARYGRAEVSLPGGCAIGTRSVHLHLQGLRQMGAEMNLNKGLIVARVKKTLQGKRILLDYPTVGGTENIMMAACLAKGITFIENAAREPEIIDLAEYLNKMGAKVKGAGTDLIQITPKRPLSPGEHTVIPDRIEAGTLLLAGAITKGHISVSSCVPSHLEALLLKLEAAGFFINIKGPTIELSSPPHFSTVNIVTAPYPGFPTDLQAQFMALMTQAKTGGVSSLRETIFENRFMHTQELARLGADVQLDGHTALVKGGTLLRGAPVTATDLRASACLILAGLRAQGETLVHRVYHLDRGYESLEKKLASLGANIKRLKE